MKPFLSLLGSYMEKHGKLAHKGLKDENYAGMIFDLVWNSIQQGEEPRIHPRVLLLQYRSLEDYVVKPLPANVSWAYLHQFDSDLSTFELGKSIRIRTANPFEAARFKQEHSEYGRTKSTHIIETMSSEAFLQSEQSVNGRGIRNHLELVVREQFRDVVSVFRIINPSGVGINIVFYRVMTMMEFSQIPFPELVPPVLCPMGETVCKMGKKQIALARKLWFRIRRARENETKYDRLLRAVETFDVALCSSRAEDMIRDVYVVFETLFKAKGKYLDEMIAVLISDDNDKKIEAQDALKEGRKTRNGSTHGSRMKSTMDANLLYKIAHIAADIISYGFASMEVSEGLEGLAGKALEEVDFRRLLRTKFQNWSPMLLRT